MHLVVDIYLLYRLFLSHVIGTFYLLKCNFRRSSNIVLFVLAGPVLVNVTGRLFRLDRNPSVRTECD